MSRADGSLVGESSYMVIRLLDFYTAMHVNSNVTPCYPASTLELQQHSCFLEHLDSILHLLVPGRINKLLPRPALNPG